MTIIFGHCSSVYCVHCTRYKYYVRLHHSEYFIFTIRAFSFRNEQFAEAHFFHPQIWLLLLVGFKNGFDLFLCAYAYSVACISVSFNPYDAAM